MNYKKSILSLVTIMALSGTASADGSATYLPLTSGTNDASWTLFGVNGLSTGVASARASSSDGFSPDFVSVKEDTGFTQDHMATCGIGATGSEMLCVQAIDDTNILQLEVAAKQDHPYEATEPVRSMYIKLNSNTPNVKIDYKASMEGQSLELIVNEGSTLYSVTIDEDNTYSNAATAVESSITASTDAKLSNIVDVLDYNFKDNPLEAKYFNAATHLDNEAAMIANGNRADSATFYHFDSITQQWKIWDKKFSGSANDFTAFSVGDAYWGQIDTNDTTPNNNAADANVTASGLILAESGQSLPDETVYAGKLTDGWNMLALDDVKPYIRHAATGLVLTVDITGSGTIRLKDSTGQHTVTVDQNTTSIAENANLINVAIERDKLLGNLPSSVNIKAFAGDTNEMVIISDAKFSVTDMDDFDNITSVKTLTNKEPYNAVGTRTVLTGDLNVSSTTAANVEVTSAYGEYALILDLMTSVLANSGVDDGVDVRVAADLDVVAGGNTAGSSAMIRIGTSDTDPAAIHLTTGPATDVAATLATFKTVIGTHAMFSASVAPATAEGNVNEIDSNGNGLPDKVILASTVPFYIKDNTYTRAFVDINATNDTTRTFTVVGSSSASVTPTIKSDYLATATLINAKTGTTGVYADVNDTDNTDHLIAVSTTLSTFDIKDYEPGDTEDATAQFFTNTVSSTKLAQGAIGAVYSLSDVARLPLILPSVSHTDFNISDASATDGNETITIRINGLTTLEANITGFTNTNTESNITSFFDLIVNTTNTLLQDNNLSGYAYHTYVDGTTEAIINSASIVIRGFDINSSTTILTDTNLTAFTDPTTTNNDEVNGTTISNITYAGANTLGLTWPSLVSDLKSNAIYTPDFASYGPLYTMNNAGYSVRSILKATTEFTNGTIAWDGIDLTRDESDWFANNEFNLFNTNVHSGYWVYLETKTADSVTIGAATFTPTYTYYFDNQDSSGDYPTTNVINGGQLTVDLSNFDGEISTAYASIAGTEVQLKQTGTSTEYTADFTKYSIANFNEGASGSINFSVRATDGKGEDTNLTAVYAFDYTAPIIVTPTAPSKSSVKFAADAATTDLAKFYVYKEYIPELDASRASATASVNRLIGSYTATAGESTTNVCEGLSFGDVNNLRVVGVDGTGEIGSANVSDAMQFEYATMLNGSEVLTHTAGSTDDKAIIGLRYDSTCAESGTQPALATDNAGISLKSLVGTSTARLAYEVISGLGSSLSGAFLTTYSISGTSVIQVQNLEEYAGKPFFVEYGGKMYRSAFPLTLAEAEGSSNTALELDDATAFTLDATTGLKDGGEGEELSSSLLNNSLAP